MECGIHIVRLLDHLEAAIQDFVEGTCEAFMDNDSIASLIVLEFMEGAIGRLDDDWNLVSELGTGLG